MILASLRDMAIREGLTGATAFENKPVKWVIALDEDGRFLGLSQTLTDSVVGVGKKEKQAACQGVFDSPALRTDRTNTG